MLRFFAIASQRQSVIDLTVLDGAHREPRIRQIIFDQQDFRPLDRSQCRSVVERESISIDGRNRNSCTARPLPPSDSYCVSISDTGSQIECGRQYKE